jgi:phosphate transport system substrate-binding protein
MFYENNTDFEGWSAVAPSVETAAAGKYPVSRPSSSTEEAHIGVIPGLRRVLRRTR